MCYITGDDGTSNADFRMQREGPGVESPLGRSRGNTSPEPLRGCFETQPFFRVKEFRVKP